MIVNLSLCYKFNFNYSTSHWVIKKLMSLLVFTGEIIFWLIYEWHIDSWSLDDWFIIMIYLFSLFQFAFEVHRWHIWPWTSSHNRCVCVCVCAHVCVCVLRDKCIHHACVWTECASTLIFVVVVLQKDIHCITIRQLIRASHDYYYHTQFLGLEKNGACWCRRIVSNLCPLCSVCINQ